MQNKTYKQQVTSYVELGYVVHTEAFDHSVLLKRDKTTSAVVVHLSGEPTRVLNTMQIDNLLQGEDRG